MKKKKHSDEVVNLSSSITRWKRSAIHSKSNMFVALSIHWISNL